MSFVCNSLTQRSLTRTLVLVAVFLTWGATAESASAQVSWNSTHWTLYDTITIDAANIDATLTDFPVYVDLADLSSQFWATTPSASNTVGTDIRVTNASNQELPRELVFASSTAETGELHFKADSISSTTDTVFKIWYNGTTTGDYATSSTYGAQNVWTNDYYAVYHLGEGDSTAAGFYRDSTAATRNATMTDADGDSAQMSGKLGFGMNIGNDNTDRIQRAGLTIATTTNFTISGWVLPLNNPVANDAYYGFRTPPDAANALYLLQLQSTNTVESRFRNDSAVAYTDTTAITPGIWNYTSLVLDGTTKRYYQNGVEIDTTTVAGSFVGTNIAFNMGADANNNNAGSDLDEIRISSTTRSAAWIEAEYVNQSTTTDFYTVYANNDPQPWNATHWTLYDTITIDAANIDATLTDFPVYVDLADLSSQFWATTPSASNTVGTDIRVTNASNQELPRELVFASSTAETGELHFKADSISSTTDTVFKIWYNGTTTGDYATSSTYGAQNVWSNNYYAVWHLSEGDSTAAGFYRDSTANNRNGTLTDADGDTVATTAARVGNAVDFNGDADLITVTGFTPPTTGNVSFWTRKDGAGEYRLLGMDDAYEVRFETSVQVAYELFHTATAIISTSFSNITGRWYNISTNYTDGGAINGFIDGSANGGGTGSGTNPAGSSFSIGNRSVSPGVYLDGSMDEVRIASTTRSAAWIEAEYLNQSTTTDFYTVNQAAGPTSSGITITGTLFAEDGVTPLSGKTVVAAVGTSTPSRHSTTTAANGSFSISGIATSTLSDWTTVEVGASGWRDVTFGNGMFIAVGLNGKVARSLDGVSWATSTVLGGNDAWIGVTYGNGIFVAVGSSGDRVMTSPDGINWTAVSAAGNNDGWQDVAYGNGIFVAVSNLNDRVMISSDGANWSVQSALGNNDGWVRVVYGQGLFVAVANSGDRIMSSPDGITWTKRGSDDNNWYTLAYGNSIFVAGSEDTGPKITYSYDGINWSTTTDVVNDAWTKSFYANGRHYIHAYGNSGRLAYSEDGITWTQDTNYSDFEYYNDAFAYGNGKAVAIGGPNGSQIIYADAGFGEDTPITVFVDENATTSSSTATTLTYGVNNNSGTTTITANLIADTLLLQKNRIGSSSNEIYLSDADVYDYTNDTDILFTATTSTTTINADLRIASGTVVYAPQNLVIDGDFINYGMFEAERGEVVADARWGDVASGRFERIALSVAAQETVPSAMLFNNTGTTLYVMGETGDDINAYTLSTPYDISTATFSNIALSVAAQETAPVAMLFNNTGTTLYVMGYSGDDINAYPLSTPFDISSGTTTNSSIALSVTAQETVPVAMLFNNTGTTLYVMGPAGADINAYTLSTPYDISTATFSNIALSVVAQETAPSAMLFNNTGTTLYVMGETGDDINAYTLSTPYDISTATFSNIALSVAAQETAPYGMIFNNTGSTLYVMGPAGQDINAYSLDDEQLLAGNFSATSSLWDLTIGDTATVSPAADTEVADDYHVGGSAAGPYAGLVTLTGTSTLSGTGNFGFVRVEGTASSTESEVTFTDLTIANGGSFTAPQSGKLNISGDFDPSAGTFTNNGATTYFGGQGTYGTSLTYQNATSASGSTNVREGIAFSPDGHLMFVAEWGSEVYTYSLSVPWDISTAAHSAATTSMSIVRAKGIDFADDGRRMYLVSSVDDVINEYVLSTPWDVTTSVFNQSLSGVKVDSSVDDLQFAVSGKKLYTIAGESNRRINEYSLSAPWDISTAVLTATSSVLTNLATLGAGLTISADGKLLAIVDFADDIHFYTMSEPYNLSTLIHITSINQSDTTNPSSVRFSADGTRLFMLDMASAEGIVSYDISALIGTSTGARALSDVVFNASGTSAFVGNASTSSFTIQNNATVTAPAGSLSLAGNLTNNGVFDMNGGDISLDGSFRQYGSISAADSALNVNGPDQATYDAVLRYVTGLGTNEISGDNTGEVLIQGTTLYFGRGTYAGTCNTTTGEFCELLVYDISSSTNPVFLTGREVGLGSAGSAVNTAIIASGTLYVGRNAYAGTCVTTTGDGCELLVYDISSTTNPVLVGGAESGLTSAGSSVNGLSAYGNTLYVTRNGYTNTCATSTGASCELLIYNIASTSNPILVGGREVGITSAGATALQSAVVGTMLYVTRVDYSGACDTTTGQFCELFVYNISSTTNPVFVTGRETDSTFTRTVLHNGSALYISISGGVNCNIATGLFCDLLVFDVSSSTNPVYVTARSTNAAGEIRSMFVKNEVLYVGVYDYSYGGTCDPVNIIMCDVLIYDVGSSTQPRFITALETGVSSPEFNDNVVFGIAGYEDMLYVGRTSFDGTCTASTGEGCELQLFEQFEDVGGQIYGAYYGENRLGDLSLSGVSILNMETASTAALTVAGTSTLPNQLTVGGDYAANGSLSFYDYDTAILTFDGSGLQSISGFLTDTNRLPTTVFTGGGANTLISTTSVGDFTIASGATVTAVAPITSGDFVNQGSYTTAATHTLLGSYENTGSVVFDTSMLEVRSYIQSYLAGVESGTSSGGSTVYSLTTFGSTLYLGRLAYSGTCNTATGEFCELLVYDISSTTNPVFVTGRESGVGSGGATVETFAISGSTLYLGRNGYTGACDTTGNGCELLVYDISSTTNPVFVTGRESGISSDGSAAYTLATVDSALYLGRIVYSGTCNTATGEFCELLVYDISSTTNPVFVTGRESGVGSGGATVVTLTVARSALYLGRNGYSGTCNTATGEFCELLVYDISSTTNPMLVTGRESGVLSEGSSIQVLASSFDSNTLYLGRNTYSDACDITTGKGCELLVYDISSSTNPTFISGRETGIGSNGNFVYALATTEANLYLGRNVYSGTCNTATGEFCEVLSYSLEADLSGTMTGASAFSDLSVEVGAVRFTDAASTTGTMTMEPGTTATFEAGETYTFQNVDWQGASGTPVTLRSSASGTPWYLDIPGSQLNVEYVDVQDSDATLTEGGVTTASSTDSGNNTNWCFGECLVEGPQPWNATHWTLYDTITIDAANIDATLTDFPVYVNLADLSAQFWATTPTSSILVGTDIRVTNASNQELPRELVFASSTAETGELHFRADTISSTTDTVFKIWYNGTTTGDYARDATYGTENVWSNDFVAVYHDGGSTDSTQFVRTLTPLNSAAEANVSGRVGRAAELSGTTQGFQTASTTGIDGLSAFTVSLWYEADTIGNRGIYSLDDNGVAINNDNWSRARLDVAGADGGGTNVLKLTTRNEAGTFQNTETSNESANTSWTLLHHTWTSGSDQLVYLNGAVDTPTGQPSGAVSGTLEADQLTIGGGGQITSGGYFDGIVDEFRIASTTRSAAWIEAEYLNQSTTTDFYAVGSFGGPASAGTTTLSNHDATQVGNAFSFQNVTNGALFAFKLTPDQTPATTTELVVTLSGADRVSSTTFTNVRLLQDNDNDAAYDAGDTLMSTGTVSLTGESGIITFGTDFAITTATNYLIVADWNAPQNGSFVTITLPATGLTVVNATGTMAIEGSTNPVQHHRNNRGGGSGGLSTEGAPGDGIRTGGGTAGGEELGGEPNFNAPTGEDNPFGAWNNSAGGFTSDGSYVNESVSGDRQSYDSFAHVISTGNQINGIEVKLEASVLSGTGTIEVALSWDAGVTHTSVYATPPLTATDTIYSLGGSSDLWGRGSWTADELNNANFRIRLTARPGAGATVQVDAITVRVYHSTAGGGSGGGSGEI